MNTYTLKIVTPEKAFYLGEISSLIAPGRDGYLGVLANHAPLITSLGIGKLTVKESSGNELVFTIGRGFLKVGGNSALILTDSVEKAEEIDIERARKAEERAKNKLKEGLDEVEFARHNVAFQRALNRVRIAQSLSQ